MNESQLVKTIKAHIAKGDKSAEKAQQHYIAAGQYLKTLKAQHGGTWAEWETLVKEKVGIGKSRASELMQIADGRKTVEDVRADTNKRKLEHRASVPERRGRTVEPGCPECSYTLAYPEPCSEGGEHWACGQAAMSYVRKSATAMVLWS